MQSKNDQASILPGIKKFLKLTSDGIQLIAEGIEEFDKAIAALSSRAGNMDLNAETLTNAAFDFINKTKTVLSLNQILNNVSSGKEGIESLLSTIFAALGSEKKSTSKKTGKKSKAAKATKAKRTAKKPNATESSIGKVSDLIAKNREGLSISQLIEQSGLTQKQIYNILSKLKEKGEIVAIARGIYVAQKGNIPSKATPGTAKAAKKAAPRKNPKKRKTAKTSTSKKTTHMDEVYAAIEKIGEASVIDISNHIKLEKKQLQNTLFKLKNAGRIENPRRGVYRIKP